MCKRCGKVKHWIHIADSWTLKEKKEMLKYLLKVIINEESTVHNGLKRLVKE